MEKKDDLYNSLKDHYSGVKTIKSNKIDSDILNEKKLEVMLKSVELVEHEMANSMQNMYKVATTLIGGVAIIYLYVINSILKSNANNLNNDTALNNFIAPNIYIPLDNIILLTIPILVCIISIYLTYHQRTLVLLSAYAKHLETNINDLLNDKIIYFENLYFPVLVSKDWLRRIIMGSIMLLYVSPFLFYIYKYNGTINDLLNIPFQFLNISTYIIILSSRQLPITLNQLFDTKILNILYFFLLCIYVIINSLLTTYCFLYGFTIKEYGSVIEYYIRNFEYDEISGNDNERLLKKYLFNWDELPGNDNERLITFLKQSYSINWIKKAKIDKIEDDKTIRVTYDKNFLSLSLNTDKTEVNLIIDDGRSDEFIAKAENGTLNIYLEKTITDLSDITNLTKKKCKKPFWNKIPVKKVLFGAILVYNIILIILVTRKYA